MRYKLIKNAYLTVIDSRHQHNRHFEVGCYFTRVATEGKYVTLIGKDKNSSEKVMIYVTKERLRECFEEVWEKSEIFSKSEFYTEDE